MKTAELKTMNGKTVRLNIPYDASEIPLARYFPARLIFDDIQALFGTEQPLNQILFLKKVTEFLGMILNVEPNELLGFRVGDFGENIAGLAAVKNQLDWQSIDVTLYRLYKHIGAVLLNVEAAQPEGDFEFTYAGEGWFVPAWMGNIDIYGTGYEDLEAWQLIEALEIQRQTVKLYEMTYKKDEYGNPINPLRYTDEEKQQHADALFNEHLRILAILVRKKGVKSMVFELGQDAIDKMIDKRMEHFKEIDCKTAYQVFFFGLNIQKLLEMNIILSFSGLHPGALRQLPRKR